MSFGRLGSMGTGFGRMGVPPGGGGAPPFTPMSLFAAGEKGIWYDPNDRATLWQDAGATVPATAVNDPVRLMQDKSGNSIHATAPSDGERPLLKQAASGDWYLQWDDVDDRMVTGALDLSAVSAFTRVMGLHFPAGADNNDVIMESVTLATTANPGGNILSLLTVSVDLAIVAHISGPTNVRGVRTVPYTMPQTFVLGQIVDVAAVGQNELLLRLNGVDARDTWTADLETGAALLSSQTYNLGCRAGGSRPGNMQLFGLVMVQGALSLAALAEVEAWMGGP